MHQHHPRARSTPADRAPLRRALRRQFLQGCSLALVLAAVVAPSRARAQAFAGTPTVVSGTVSIDRSVSGRDTITTGSANAVVNWTPTDNSGSGTINFLPSGTIAEYNSDSGTGAGYTILNRILPATTSRPVGLNGTIQGYQGGTTTPGGSVWFYSPGGFIVGSTAAFDIGNLLLTANPVTVGGGGELTSGGTIQLRPGPTAGAQITLMPGASIMANAEGSYIGLVAPRIAQGGTINVNGAAALVAAESVDLTFQAGLFNINVLSGSDAGADSFVHNGTTTGPSSTGVSDPHRIYMVAVSKNAAITMLLSGTAGFQAASSASIENGRLILSAGRDIAGGDPPASPASIGSAAIARVDAATITSPLSIFASSAAQLTASGVVPLARIDANGAATVNTAGTTGSGPVRSGAGVSIIGGTFGLGDVSGTDITIDVTGNFVGGTLTSTRDLALDADGSVMLAGATTGDDMLITADSANLTTLRTLNTGGDNEGDGANIRVTTAGNIQASSADATHGIFLTTTANGSITGNTLHTNSGGVTATTNGTGTISLTTIDAQGAINLMANGNAAITGTDIMSRGTDITVMGGALNLGDLNARDITLTSNSTVGAVDVTASRDFRTDATGMVTMTSITSGDDLVINANSVDLETLRTTNTGGDNEGNGANIQITTVGNIDITNADATHNISLTTTGNGTIIADMFRTNSGGVSATTQGSGLLSIRSIDAQGTISLNAAAGAPIAATQLTSRGADLSVTGANFTLGNVSARDVTMTSSGIVGVTNITASRDLTIGATGKVTATMVTSGDDLVINAGSVDLQTLRTFNTGGDNEGNGANIQITTVGNIDITNADATHNISLTTTGNGTITADSFHTNSGGVTATTQGSGLLSIQSIDAGGAINLTAAAGAPIAATDLTSRNSDLSVTGASFTLGDVSARDVTMTSSGVITTSDITASRDLRIDASGKVTVTSATSGDDLIVNANSVDLQTLETTNTGGDNEGNGANIRIQTAGDIELSSADAIGFANAIKVGLREVQQDVPRRISHLLVEALKPISAPQAA